MHTKEVHESQTDELSRLSEEVGAKFARARRASGLSQWQFANKLGIPPCYAEILENGILVMDDHRHYRRWHGHFFTRKELEEFSVLLEKGIPSAPGEHPQESETVFFCPVTINGNAVNDEIHAIAGCKNIAAFTMQRMIYALIIKYRILHELICMKEGRKMADRMRERALSLLTAYQKRY